MPLDTFCGPGTALDVSDVEPRDYITAERLERALEEAGGDLREGDVLLLRTGTAERFGGTPEYTTQYPGFDQSAADWLRAHPVRVFGVDSPSPDTPGDRIYPVHLFSRETRHHALREPGQPRARSWAERFTFFGFPLRIRGRPRLARPRRRDARRLGGEIRCPRR